VSVAHLVGEWMHKPPPGADANLGFYLYCQGFPNRFFQENTVEMKKMYTTKLFAIHE
jgi:hypothetical protein